MDDKRVEWNGARSRKPLMSWSRKGHMIASPTKVGYIIMTSDGG
jgi:hypothetical protein